MAGVNKVILIGNLGADPDFKTTSTGAAVCKLSIATSRSWKNKNTDELETETEWHRVTVWGKSAEHCNNYLSKGRSVYVEGRLRTSSYEQDGIKKWSTEVVADTVQFLGSKNDNEGDGGGGNSGGGNSGGGGGGGGGNTGNAPSGEVDPDDDIPF